MLRTGSSASWMRATLVLLSLGSLVIVAANGCAADVSDPPERVGKARQALSCFCLNDVACPADTACTYYSCDPCCGPNCYECTPHAQPDGTSCSDGNVCNGDEKCVNGLCQAGQALPCDDGNPCTLDYCDPGQGCLRSLVSGCCLTDADCNAGGACTSYKCDITQHVCTSTPIPNCCQQNSDCNDNNVCTTDTCDPATHNCLYAAVGNGTPCPDSNLCNGTEKCQSGACTGGTALSCDDGNSCTTDTCDPSSGCVNTPMANSSACNDGNDCSTGDNCQNGACTSTAGLNCNDTNPCTTDSCNTSTQQCNNVSLTNGSPCSDGNSCTVGDNCQSGLCVSGSTLNCDDGKECTTDTCDQTSGCIHTPRDGQTCSLGVCQNDVCVSPDGGGTAGSGGTGGTVGSGGTSGSGGKSGSGGVGGANDGGTNRRGNPLVRDPATCACRSAGGPATARTPLALALGLLFVFSLRRRRERAWRALYSLRAVSRKTLTLLIFLAIFSGAYRADAETDEERATAREAATEGMAAYQQKHWADAIDLFGRAESLVHAPPHVLYLARSHAALGHLVKARELLSKLTHEELAQNAPKAFRDAQLEAQKDLAALEPRVSRLKIVVQGGGNAKATVTMDGATYLAAAIGVLTPTDPGEHKLQATAPGLASEVVSVSLAEGERKSVTLELHPAAPSAGPASAAAAGPQPSAASSGGIVTDTGVKPAEQKPSSGLRIASYTALGVGVVGLGIGTIFGLKTRSKIQQADDLAAQCGPDCRTGDPQAPQIVELDDEAHSAKTVSTVGFVVGGVGIAAGVAMFILSNSQGSKAETARARITAWIGPRAAGLVGSF